MDEVYLTRDQAVKAMKAFLKQHPYKGLLRVTTPSGHSEHVWGSAIDVVSVDLPKHTGGLILRVTAGVDSPIGSPAGPGEPKGPTITRPPAKEV